MSVSPSTPYDPNDFVQEDITKRSENWKVFEEHFILAESAIENLIKCRCKHVQQISTTDVAFPSRFGFNKESGIFGPGSRGKPLYHRL